MGFDKGGGDMGGAASVRAIVVAHGSSFVRVIFCFCGGRRLSEDSFMTSSNHFR